MTNRVKKIVITNAVIVGLILFSYWIFSINNIKDYYVSHYGTDYDEKFLVYGDVIYFQEITPTISTIDVIELNITSIDNGNDYTGTFTVQLSDTQGNIIQNWNKKKYLLNNEQWIEFKLDNALNQNKTYIISISAPQLNKDNGIIVAGTYSKYGINENDAYVSGKSYYSLDNGYNEGAMYVSVAKGYTNVFYIGAVLCVLLALNYYMLNEEKGIEKYAFILIFLIGLSFIFCMANASGPDEPYHYKSSYVLSNILLGKEANKFDSRDIIDLEYYHNNYNYIYMKELKNDEVVNDAESTDVIEQEGTYSYYRYPELHVVQAIGMSTGRMFGIHGAALYLWARLFNWTVFSIVCAWAIKIVPYNKELLLILSLNPMTIHQATQLSYDGFIIGVSVLYLVLIINMYEKNADISIKNAVILLMLLLLFAPSKIVYLPHFILLAYLLYNNKKILKDKIIYVIAIIFFIITIYAYINGTAIITNSSIMDTTSWYNLNDSFSMVSATYGVKSVVDNIGYAIRVFFSSSQYNIINYILQAFGYKLGGQSIIIYEYLIVIYIVVIVYYICMTWWNNSLFIRLSKFSICLVLIGIIEFVLILMSGFIMTPFGKNMLDGVQGRYLIPSIYLLVYGLSNKKEKIEIDNGIKIVFAIYIVIISQIMSKIIY